MNPNSFCLKAVHTTSVYTHPSQAPLLEESYKAQQGSQALGESVEGKIRKKKKKKKKNPNLNPTHAFVSVFHFHFHFHFHVEFHIRFISLSPLQLPTPNPATDCLQGRVIINPVTSAQISSPQVRHNMLVREASQILMEGSSCGLQGCRVLGCWRGAAEDTGARHGPSPGCGGAQVDLVRLESACAAVQDNSEERLLA